MNLLLVEIRRALRRRVIRVLILIALAWCAFAGVVGYLSSAGKTVAQLHYRESTHPAVLVDWWHAGTGDTAITTAALFLLIGGFFAGAAVAGAEWRAGTITTVLTWEPRRTRLNLTRTAACGICAFVIAFLLQVIFLASFLPAVLANGTTAGADRNWWISLTLAVARTSVVTSIAAMLGVALGAVFAWVVVIEGLIRGLRPGWAQYLWGENVATTVQWGQLRNVGFSRGPLLASATIALYTAVFVVLATIAFRRRDIAGAQ